MTLSDTVTRQEGVIGENIALMEGGREGGMQFYLLRVARDDRNRTRAKFLYNPNTGKINFFGGIDEVPAPTGFRDDSFEGCFIALMERSPQSRYRVSILELDERSAELARETLEETVSRYNQTHGF